jgi:D-alanyl-D-alanine dipeptidase
MPPVSPQARAAGLADVRTVVPDAVIGVRCLVHESPPWDWPLPRISHAHKVICSDTGNGYRPHDFQTRMFQEVPDPNFGAPAATRVASKRPVGSA